MGKNYERQEAHALYDEGIRKIHTARKNYTSYYRRNPKLILWRCNYYEEVQQDFEGYCE